MKMHHVELKFVHKYIQINWNDRRNPWGFYRLCIQTIKMKSPNHFHTGNDLRIYCNIVEFRRQSKIFLIGLWTWLSTCGHILIQLIVHRPIWPDVYHMAIRCVHPKRVFDIQWRHGSQQEGMGHSRVCLDLSHIPYLNHFRQQRGLTSHEIINSPTVRHKSIFIDEIQQIANQALSSMEHFRSQESMNDP